MEAVLQVPTVVHPSLGPEWAGRRPYGCRRREEDASWKMDHARCEKQRHAFAAVAEMYLAVPLSWSLSLVRPVTLRPNLSVGLPFDSYLAVLSAIALLACDSRDRGAQARVALRSRPQLSISIGSENFSGRCEYNESRQPSSGEVSTNSSHDLRVVAKPQFNDQRSAGPGDWLRCTINPPWELAGPGARARETCATAACVWR